MAMVLVAALLLLIAAQGKEAWSEGIQMERVWASAIGNLEASQIEESEDGIIQERTEMGAATQAHAVSGVSGIEPQSQIDDEGHISSVISNLDDLALKFWLTGTTHYRIDPAYSPVMIFENTLGGEGIEVKPGTRTRQAYLIQDGRAERLERALETRFYRVEHFAEPFPLEFDYLGFCDYREAVMTLVPNPFLLEEGMPQPDPAAAEESSWPDPAAAGAPSPEEAIYANYLSDFGFRKSACMTADKKEALRDSVNTVTLYADNTRVGAVR